MSKSVARPERRKPLPRDAVVCLMRQDLEDMLEAPLYAVEMRRAWSLMKRRIGGRFSDSVRNFAATLGAIAAFRKSKDGTPEARAQVEARGMQWARMVMAAAAVGEPKLHLAMSPIPAVEDWCWGLLFCLDCAIMLNTYPTQDVTWLVQPRRGDLAFHCWQEVFWVMLDTDALRRIHVALGAAAGDPTLPPAFAVHG